MQVFFVIDGAKDLDKKIDIIRESVSDNIKFFVKTKYYLDICTNQYIIPHLAGVFTHCPNKKIDEYIKSEHWVPDDVIVYYSSAEINESLLTELIKKSNNHYDEVSFKKRNNAFVRFFEKIYKFITKKVYRYEDKIASVKLQFLSKESMQGLVETKFNNRILKIENNATIDLSLDNKPLINSYKTKFMFGKGTIINAIVNLSILLMYVVFVALFKLRFFVHFFFVGFLIGDIIIAILIIVNDIFHSRYGHK